MIVLWRGALQSFQTMIVPLRRLAPFLVVALLSHTILVFGQQPNAPLFRSKLNNISARTFVQSGDNVAIGGFIIAEDSKRVIIRGLGPSLAVGGTPLANRLANPTLTLYNGAGSVISFNADWRATQAQEIQDSGLAPTNDLEAAILATLAQGNYTAVLRGAGGGTGLGLIEIYDLEKNSALSELTNLSARGFVGTGDNLLIAGLIFEGGNSLQLLVRALGPSLTRAGVPSALQNPTLTLYDSNGAVIESNDNWKDAPNVSEIVVTGLAPTDDREAAILTTFAPGSYTAIVRGLNGTTGNALAELYRQADGP